MSYTGGYGRGSGSRGRSLSRSSDSPDEFGTDYTGLDTLFTARSSSRHRSRSRRPSISVAYAGASFSLDQFVGPEDAALPPQLMPSGSPRRSSRYPPSSSRTSALLRSLETYSLEDSTRSRSRRRSSISLYPDDPDVSVSQGVFPLELDARTAPGYRSRCRSRPPSAASSAIRARIPYRSKFFGSGTSSSSFSAGHASRSPDGEDPIIPDVWASRSSDRSSRGIVFGRSSDEGDLGEPRLRSRSQSRTRRDARGAPQIRRTSFRSGFSDQMEYGSDGEHFAPGTAIHTLHSDYTAAKPRAGEAIEMYKGRRSQIPWRKKTLDGPDPALGEDYLSLRANYTVPEHRELRRLAHQAFRNRRDEAIGRKTFNDQYSTVWEKRFLQTGKDSLTNHLNKANERRDEADEWLERRDQHGDCLLDLRVPEDDITPVSSWGSGRWRQSFGGG